MKHLIILTLAAALASCASIQVGPRKAIAATIGQPGPGALVHIVLYDAPCTADDDKLARPKDGSPNPPRERMKAATWGEYKVNARLPVIEGCWFQVPNGIFAIWEDGTGTPMDPSDFGPPDQIEDLLRQVLKELTV